MARPMAAGARPADRAARDRLLDAAPPPRARSARRSRRNAGSSGSAMRRRRGGRAARPRARRATPRPAGGKRRAAASARGTRARRAAACCAPPRRPGRGAARRSSRRRRGARPRAAPSGSASPRAAAAARGRRPPGRCRSARRSRPREHRLAPVERRAGAGGEHLARRVVAPAVALEAAALLARAVAPQHVAGVVEQRGVGEVEQLGGDRRRARAPASAAAACSSQAGSSTTSVLTSATASARDRRDARVRGAGEAAVARRARARGRPGSARRAARASRPSSRRRRRAPRRARSSARPRRPAPRAASARRCSWGSRPRRPPARRYPLRWRAVPFTVVVVLHDSAAELAALLRSIDAQLGEPPQLGGGRHRHGRRRGRAGRARGAPRCSSGATTRASAPRATPGWSARGTTSPCCSIPTASCSTGRSQRWRRVARAYPRALHAPRLLNARRERPALRASAPGHGRRAGVGAALHPPLLPRALRERLEPYRAERVAHRRLGDRRVPGGRHGGAAPARSVRSRGPPVRRGHGPLPARPRGRAADRPAPVTARPPHGRPRDAARGRAVRPAGRAAARVVAAARGRRALALDDAAQALTFASRAAGHALLGGDARPAGAPARGARRARGGSAA